MRPQMYSVEPQRNLFAPIYLRFVIGAFALILLISSVAPGRAAPSDTSTADPMAELKSAISEAIALFQNQSMPLTQRREKLRDLAMRRFDFAVMARSVLGYHWRELSADQRSQFVPVFAGFIQDAYLSKLRDYTVQKVQQEVQTLNIQYTRETFDGPDYAQVNTSVRLQEQKDPVQVNYLMHLDGGHWRIYDVTIDAISVIANYRNQFNRVINRNGYDQLVADLKSKQQQFRQTLDQPDSSAPQH
jgi:phospholipid transport system substrate-binding protein